MISIGQLDRSSPIFLSPIFGGQISRLRKETGAILWRKGQMGPARIQFIGQDSGNHSAATAGQLRWQAQAARLGRPPTRLIAGDSCETSDSRAAEHRPGRLRRVVIHSLGRPSERN